LKLSNLTVRVLTAAVAVPVLVAAVICPRHEGVWTLVFLFTLAGLAEFFALTMPGASRRELALAVAAGGAFSATLFWCPDRQAPLWVLCAIVMLSLSARLFGGRTGEAAARTGLLLLGTLYVGLLFATLALLRLRPAGAAWVGLAVAMTFANDTLAYFAGRFFGRHKLHPGVSPGKTIEGAVGGTAGAVAAALLARAFWLPELTLWDCAWLGVPAGVLGQVGDLCESMIKRGAGRKDSGRLMPGHGGVLDRIDGLLFVSPYVYLYARWAIG
jgi:phosphatidate cytidylyltransferase